MFVCEPCHAQHFEGWHVKTTSVGPCEVCGKHAECYDCRHDRAKAPHPHLRLVKS